MTKGDRLRAYYQIRGLSESFDIYLICTSDEEITKEDRKEVEKYCKQIVLFPLSKWGIYFFSFINIFRSKPFQVAYFYRYYIHQKIIKLINEIQPDHIFSQLIRSSEYVKNYHLCPKTIDYMDAFSKGMERRSKYGFPIFRWFFKMESQRTRIYETKIFDYFENHLVISKQDQEYIFHPDYRMIKVMPNGIDESFFEKIRVDKKADIAFVGNLSYEPNVLAVQFLYERIYRQLPDLKFCISGANPSHRILKYSTNNFQVAGFVKDIRMAYSSARIFVAPMYLGTGLQNKILEAMAQGIPCITTSLVNNAVGAKVGEEILIAETADEFCDTIQHLLADELLYSSISNNAQTFVKNNFSWKQITDNLASIMGT